MGCRLWICVLICQLPHFFHPSLHLLPSSPDVISLHHTVISLFLPTLPSTISLIFTPLFFSHIALSKWSPKQGVYVCLCVYFVLVQGKISVWPVVRAKDCLYNRLLLGDRETTNSESEWVYVCLIALSCVFVLACLGLFLCELGSVLVWESLSVSLSFSEANLLSEGHHSSEEQ